MESPAQPLTPADGVEGDDEYDEYEDDARSEIDDGGAESSSDEEEPRLKYQRMAGSMPSLLSNDAASCITVAERMIALGTHDGTVHLLDYQGNQYLVEETAVPEMEIGGPPVIHPIAEEPLLDLPLPPSYLPPTWFPLDFFLSDSISDIWTEDRVVYQLMFAIETLLESIRVPVQDFEELCEQSEDCMGRLVWLQDQSSWYLPFPFLLRPDWPHPLSVVMWSIRDVAVSFGTQEDRLRTWAQEMVSGICRGFSVAWVKEFAAHTATVNELSFDAIGEFIGSCSDDGSVVVNSLYSDEKERFDFHRPMKAVALDPDYEQKSTRRFVAGGLAGQLVLHGKAWFGNREQILHSQEGPIHAIKWRTSLIAWANDVGVKVYDTASNQRLTYIERPRGSPRAELIRPNLVWQDDTYLVIGWGDSVKVAAIRTRRSDKVVPNRNQPYSGSKYVEIVSTFQTQYHISGIAPYEDALVILAYLPEEEAKLPDPPDGVPSRQVQAQRPEVRIISWKNEELTRDALPIHGYEHYKVKDYFLAHAPFAGSSSAGGQWTDGDEPLYYIVSPKDVVIARPRDADDHVNWLLEHNWHEKALAAVHAGKARKELLDELSDSVSTDALLARSPICSSSRLLVFQRWIPQFDQDEFDRQQQIPRFSVTLSFSSLPIFMRWCIPRMTARWGIVIPGSCLSEIGTPRIQVYTPGDTQFPDLVHIRDRAEQIRAQRMVVTGRPDQCLRCNAFEHHARACPRQPQVRRQAQVPPIGTTTEQGCIRTYVRIHTVPYASAPVLGTTQDAPRPITWTYELTPEDETEMQTAIEHFSGRTLVGRLMGTTPSRPTVREWIESALGGSPARILELSMITTGLFLLQLSDSVSTDALLARSPISSGSRLLVFQRWTPQFDQDEFERQQQIPRFPVTLSFSSLPIFMRRCIPRMAATWGILIPGSLVSEIGTPRIQVGSRYLDHLILERQYAQAAALCPKLLRGSAAAWERCVFQFAQLRQLPALAPYIPTSNPQLRDTAYEIVLNALITNPAFHKQALSIIQTWPSAIYSVPAITTAIELQLSTSAKSPLLQEALAELYLLTNQYEKALALYVELLQPKVFDFIKEHNLYDSVHDKVLPLMQIDGERAVALLVQHLSSIPPAEVVSQLQRAGTDSKFRHLMHLYLHELFEKDPNAGKDFHGLQVELYAEYEPRLLLPFLRSSHYYSLDKAYDVCTRRSLTRECVFILGRMGNSREALSLIIKQLKDMEEAVEFVAAQHDDDLWEELINQSLSNPQMIGALLELTVGNIDPLHLVSKVPNGMQIPRLRDRLVKIVTDYRTETSLRNGCNNILKADCVNLSVRYLGEARHAIFVGSRDEGTNERAQSVGLSRLPSQGGTPTAMTGGSGKCCICFDPVALQNVSVVAFFCTHVYHVTCLAESSDSTQPDVFNEKGNYLPNGIPAQSLRAYQENGDSHIHESDRSNLCCILCTTAAAASRRKS
ncbi:hypothetical protein L7F22_033609 [Adiantum nelumboides]|nr:hypothetical protein [Adiantum nelumboides]